MIKKTNIPPTIPTIAKLDNVPFSFFISAPPEESAPVAAARAARAAEPESVVPSVTYVVGVADWLGFMDVTVPLDAWLGPSSLLSKSVAAAPDPPDAPDSPVLLSLCDCPVAE